MPKKRKCWKHTEGGHGETVTVYERRPGGILYARALDPSLRRGRGGYRRISLKHRDQERAKTYTLEQAAKLRQGRNELAERKITLARLLALYQTYRTPRKSAGEQGEDKRRAEIWTLVLGGQKDPHLISLGDWEGFIEARRSGAITAHGNPVAKTEDRVPVRAGTVEADCKWLRQVLGWSTRWRERNGSYLLRENAVRGYEVEGEQNPRRPVATGERYKKLRAVSDKVRMGRWRGRRSYLSELLDVAYGTGRRISAILSLRYQDLRLVNTKNAPHGAIQWPGETDKMGKEWSAPITARVRAALDTLLRQRPGIGTAYLFPSPTDPNVPVSKDLASAWLERAERLSKLPKQRGSLWHAYRRGWVTARKHLPDPDVAAAGGWKDVTTLKNCYQQPDDGTILAVVLGGRELKEQQA